MLEHAHYEAARVVSDHPTINLVLHTGWAFAPQDTAAEYPCLEHGDRGLNIATLVLVLPESLGIAHEKVERPPEFAPDCTSKAFPEGEKSRRAERRDELIGVHSAVELIAIHFSNDRVLCNLRQYARKVFKFTAVAVMNLTCGRRKRDALSPRDVRLGPETPHLPPRSGAAPSCRSRRTRTPGLDGEHRKAAQGDETLQVSGQIGVPQVVKDSVPVY